MNHDDLEKCYKCHCSLVDNQRYRYNYNINRFFCSSCFQKCYQCDVRIKGDDYKYHILYDNDNNHICFSCFQDNKHELEPDGEYGSCHICHRVLTRAKSKLKKYTKYIEYDPYNSRDADGNTVCSLCLIPIKEAYEEKKKKDEAVELLELRKKVKRYEQVFSLMKEFLDEKK